METPAELYNKSYTFEIYVKQLELRADAKRYVRFSWAAGNNRYETARVLIYPGLTKHKIDEVLVLDHAFRPGEATTTQLEVRFAHPQIHDAHDEADPKRLGECEVDLLKLLNVTNPVKFKLYNQAHDSIAVHTYVSATPKSPTTSKPPSSKSSKRSLAEERSNSSLEGTVVSSLTESSVTPAHAQRPTLEEGQIFTKISKMSTKLSHIEKEILRKTYKLNQLNRENVTEINRIRDRLERDISRKDLQIKILVSQLDELHTALAISHQRELELTERVPLQSLVAATKARSARQPSVSGSSKMEARRIGDTRLEQAAAAGTDLDLNDSVISYNKSVLSELASNFSELQKFKQDYESLDDPAVKISKCKNILNNLQKIRKMPRALGRTAADIPGHERGIPAVGAAVVRRSAAPVKGGTRVVPESVSTRGFGGTVTPLVLPRGLQRQDGQHRAAGRTLLPKIDSGSLVKSGGSRSEFRGDIDALFRHTNVHLKSDLKTHLRHQPRMVLTRGPETFQVPRLVEIADKFQKSPVGVFIPKVKTPAEEDTRSVRSKRSSVVSTERDPGTKEVVEELEKELVVTKVKLADSETVKEVYFNQLRPKLTAIAE